MVYLFTGSPKHDYSSLPLTHSSAPAPFPQHPLAAGPKGVPG